MQRRQPGAVRGGVVRQAVINAANIEAAESALAVAENWRVRVRALQIVAVVSNLVCHKPVTHVGAVEARLQELGRGQNIRALPLRRNGRRAVVRFAPGQRHQHRIVRQHAALALRRVAVFRRPRDHLFSVAHVQHLAADLELAEARDVCVLEAERPRLGAVVDQ